MPPCTGRKRPDSMRRCACGPIARAFSCKAIWSRMTVRWSVCSTIRPCWRCIASRPVASPDAALPPCRPSPHRPARGWASGKWKKNLSKSACALPRRPPPMRPNAAGAGASVAKCMTTVPSRCISGHITKRSVFPGCWALLTGPRCGPGLAAQGDQKNGLCHGPFVPHAAQTGRHGRKRRLACRGLPPAAAGVIHDAGPVCIPTGCSSIRYFVLATPFASTQVPVGPYSTFAQRLKGPWDTHAPPCRDSPFLSRVMGKKYFAASEGYGIESIGNENEFLFHNKGRTA